MESAAVSASWTGAAEQLADVPAPLSVEETWEQVGRSGSEPVAVTRVWVVAAAEEAGLAVLVVVAAAAAAAAEAVSAQELGQEVAVGGTSIFAEGAAAQELPGEVLEGENGSSAVENGSSRVVASVDGGK